MRIRNTPANTVAMARPSSPSLATIPATIVAKAAVGPAICTLLPPSAEITNPATIAVKIPASGPTPDASASAMDNGSAIIATMIPAVTSLKNCSRLYDFKEVNNIGFKEFIRISISFLSFIHNSLEL